MNPSNAQLLAPSRPNAVLSYEFELEEIFELNVFAGLTVKNVIVIEAERRLKEITPALSLYTLELASIYLSGETFVEVKMKFKKELTFVSD